VKYVQNLQHRLRKQTFCPTLLGAVIGSSFISRRGLCRAITKLSPGITGEVLDFGCGSKPYKGLFTNAHSYLGVDLKTSGHSHVDSHVDVYYDGRTLEFPDKQFDAIVSFEVFEHVFNLPDILQELNRVTKDSGKLLISIPFGWPEHEVPYDFARYTTFGITHILKLAGYEVIEIIKTTTSVLTAWQMLIDYVVHVGSPNGALRAFLQIFIAFPMTVLAYLMDALCPKRYDCFCNTVVLARKTSSPGSAGR
jgi:SAM-dependent methyltransferase